MAVGEPLANQSKSLSGEGLQALARDYVEQLCTACGRFLHWEHEHVLKREPTARELEDHRKTLKWLLRAARLVHAVAADPDFPEASARNSLEGVIWQLEESWKAVYEPMPGAEAD